MNLQLILTSQNYLEKAYRVNLIINGNVLTREDSYKFKSIIGSNSKGHVNELEKTNKLYNTAQQYSALPENRYNILCGGKKCKESRK